MEFGGDGGEIWGEEVLIGEEEGGREEIENGDELALLLPMSKAM